MSKFGAVRLRNSDGTQHADPNANGQLPVLAEVSGMEFEDGSLRVAIQDQYSDIIDYYLRRDINTLAFSSTQTLSSYTVTVSANPGITVGNILRIQEESRLFQGKILGISGTTLTIDTPLDYPFTSAASVAESSADMAVDGSVTPVAFSLGPDFNNKWDIVRISIEITHAAAADDSRFGDIAGGLTRGIVLRKRDGIYHTIFNAKTNGDLRLRADSLSYSDRASAVPGSEYGTSFMRSFGGQGKNGVVVRLDGALDESIELIVQDNLTSLASFRAVVQGHVVR